MLITGGSGTLGRDLVHLCLRRSIPFHVLGRRELTDLSPDRLTHLRLQVGTSLIHLAAAVPGKHARPDDHLSSSSTRHLDQSVVRVADHYGLRLIYPSGCSLYAPSNQPVVTESSLLRDDHTSPYLEAKRLGEQLACSLERHAVLRIASPLGPGLPDQVVAARFVREALAGRAIQVWGSGRREQNFVDTRDVAAAILMAATKGFQGVANVCSDAPTTMYELARMVVERTGIGGIQVGSHSDPHEHLRARYSNAAAFTGFGWRPRFTLSSSIDRMIRYMAR